MKFKGLINIGSGKEISIRNLTEMVADIVGFKNKLVFDSSKLDGTPRKLLDSSRMRKLGWKVKTDLRRGVELACKDYLRTVG